MELIERDEELALLARLRERATAGRGAAVVVGGPIASGKSGLLDVFLSEAADSGFLPLTANATASEQAITLGVFSQFVLGAPLTAAERGRLTALIEVGIEAIDERPRTSGRLGPASARLAEQLCVELIALAQDRPLAVVVDDVHHADTASLACLGHLVRRIRDARIVAAFGHADEGACDNQSFRAQVLRQPHGSELRLRTLSRAAVGRMAAGRLGRAAAAALNDALVAASGGSPLLVGALLDDHLAAQRESLCEPQSLSSLAAGPYYARAVAAILYRGGPPLEALAHGLAVFDEPGSLDRLLETDTTSVDTGLRALGAAGLLVDRRFREPAAKAAVLAANPPERGGTLRARAAEIGYHENRPATWIAEHLRAARRAAGPWAVPVLEEAAGRELAEGRIATGIEYLRLAVDLCPQGPLRAKITTTLVRAEWRLNPSTSARYLAELLDAMEAGYLSGGDAVVLAKALLWHGRSADAADVLTRLADSVEMTHSETLTELQVTRPWMRCSYAPLVDHMPLPECGPGTFAEATGTEARSRYDAAHALDSVLTKGPSEQVVEEAERVLRTSRLKGMGMDTVESALLALTYAERPDRAAPWCDALIEEATRRESPSRRARLSAIRSEISVRQGDLRGAERHARSSLETMPAKSWGVAIGSCLGSLLTALAAMGLHDEATETLNSPVPDEILQSRFGLHYLQARGRYNLTVGDLDGALVDFRRCGGLMEHWDLDVPGLIAWRNDVAETWLMLKERERATTLLEEQLNRYGRAASPRAFGTALRLLASTLEPRQRPALLRKAAAILQESGNRYELAVTLSDLTTAYHELGEPRRARVIGRQAWTLAVACDAQPLSRLLAAESGRPEPETAASAGPGAMLSKGEQRVADMVMLGHTNREISNTLYITVSTVEQHLTRIYRKLNVTNRADLAFALSSRRLADSRVWPDSAAPAAPADR